MTVDVTGLSFVEVSGLGVGVGVGSELTCEGSIEWA